MIASQIARLRSSVLARNAGWVFAGQGLSFVTQALYFIALARLLSASQYGVLAAAVSLVSLLAQYGGMGSGLLLLRYVSQDHRQFSIYWGNALLSIALFGTIILAGLQFFGRWLVGADSASLVILIAISDCILAQISTCAGQVFQAHEQMRLTATLNLLNNFLRLILVFVMLRVLHHALARQWAVCMLVVSLFAATTSLVIVTRRFGWPTFRPRLLFSRVGEGVVFAVSGSTTSAYNDIDKVMLGHYGMNLANGIYSMAYRFINIASMPIQSVQAAAFPRFFREGAKGVAGVYPLARKILKRTALFGLAVAVGMFLFAPVIPFLIGSAFKQSVSALRWLCLIPMFRSFHLCAGDAIAGAGQQKLRLLCQSIAAGGNFALNLYLIPRFSWFGAAIASLLTDGGLAVLTWTMLLWLRQREAIALRESAQAR